MNHYQLSNASNLEFGLDLRQLLNDWDYRVNEYTNFIGDTIPGDTLTLYESATVGGAFLSLITRPVERLTTTIGLRFDWSGLSDNYYLSPRFSFSYDLTDRTALTGASGIYYQFLTPSVVAQDNSFRDLRDPMAVHYILGMRHLLTPDTRLTLEAYYKHYYYFPMDPNQPQLALADEYGFGRYVGTFDELFDVGEAYATGVEATL